MNKEFKESLDKAQRIAVKAHDEQRYGTHPYAFHLERVYATLGRFGIEVKDREFESVNNRLLLASWLHDTLEDTNLKRKDIAEEFGVSVAELVWRVTDEPGANRSERKRATLPKIAQSLEAIVLKLADRIANVEYSAAESKSANSKFAMYSREWPEFRDVLAAGIESNPESLLKAIAQAMLAYLEKVLGDRQ